MGGGQPRDVYSLVNVLYLKGEFHRAIYYLQTNKLNTTVYGVYLVAKVTRILLITHFFVECQIIVNFITDFPRLFFSARQRVENGRKRGRLWNPIRSPLYQTVEA